MGMRSNTIPAVDSTLVLSPTDSFWYCKTLSETYRGSFRPRLSSPGMAAEGWNSVNVQQQYQCRSKRCAPSILQVMSSYLRSPARPSLGAQKRQDEMDPRLVVPAVNMHDPSSTPSST